MKKAIFTLLFLSVTSYTFALFSATERLHFPDTASLGEVLLLEDVNCFTCGNGEEQLGEAKGTIVINRPAEHWYVQLNAIARIHALMPSFKDASLSSINALILSGSDIQDEDMQYLSHLHLERLDLSGTAVSGAGLRYIKPHKFFWLNLVNTPNFNIENLSFLQGEEKWGMSIIFKDKRRSEQARKILCSPNPDICKRNMIQID